MHLALVTKSSVYENANLRKLLPHSHVPELERESHMDSQCFEFECVTTFANEYSSVPSGNICGSIQLFKWALEQILKQVLK